MAALCIEWPLYHHSPLSPFEVSLILDPTTPIPNPDWGTREQILERARWRIQHGYDPGCVTVEALIQRFRELAGVGGG